MKLLQIEDDRSQIHTNGLDSSIILKKISRDGGTKELLKEYQQYTKKIEHDAINY